MSVLAVFVVHVAGTSSSALCTVGKLTIEETLISEEKTSPRRQNRL